MKPSSTLHSPANLDNASAARHATELEIENVGPSEGEMTTMAALGVLFDGRSYWYRNYRYDLLDDALAYARLDRARSTGQDRSSDPHPWRGRAPPPSATQELMTQLGIVFDGRGYRYRSFRYDEYIDAINFSQSTLAHYGPLATTLAVLP